MYYIKKLFLEKKQKFSFEKNYKLLFFTKSFIIFKAQQEKEYY